MECVRFFLGRRHRRRVSQSPAASLPHVCSTSGVQLTVWCKSLLFNGHGYTVYDDANGKLVFRVDNYDSHIRNRREAVLMDSVGVVLLTVRRRRKKLSIRDGWEIYEGETGASLTAGLDRSPLFRVTKALGSPSCTVSRGKTLENPAYRMSWCTEKEDARIFAGAADSPPVAEVRRKRRGGGEEELLGKDVLTVKVQPGMGHALAVALVMISDAMR